MIWLASGVQGEHEPRGLSSWYGELACWYNNHNNNNNNETA